MLKTGTECTVLAVGSMVCQALTAIQELEQELHCSLGLFNCRFIKPLPEKQILDLAKQSHRLLFVEENALQGGFSSAVLEFLADQDLLTGLSIKRLGLADRFWEHGKQNELRDMAGLDVQDIKQALKGILSSRPSRPE